MPEYLALTASEPVPAVLVILAVLGVAASSYCLGSVNFAIVFTYLFSKQDIRELGSKNAGTSNVLRSAGLIPGILTGLFDFLKGVLAVYIGYWLFETAGFNAYTGGCFASLFVLLGHLYPIFFKYRGGKGIMTMAGILVVLHFRVFLVLIGVYFLMVLITRIMSVAGLTAIALLPIVNAVACELEGRPWGYSSLYFVFVAALVFYAHRENIKRLCSGTEKKLVIKKPK